MLECAPSDAHCYQRWSYPTPQPGCGRAIAHRASEQSHDWYVEFILPEPDERAQAVEALKAKMGE